MTTHCMPELERPSSRTMSGAAMETMVWSMNVIATANIIAASATVWFGSRPPSCCAGGCCEPGSVRLLTLPSLIPSVASRMPRGLGRTVVEADPSRMHRATSGVGMATRGLHDSEVTL
ncbi:hypothetical protein GCM10010222_59120 [Streptomyces tanashiensis]|nr:hypothetical protein GCM10010222_59120 [Streptomyces tanashiensis]